MTMIYIYGMIDDDGLFFFCWTILETMSTTLKKMLPYQVAYLWIERILWGISMQKWLCFFVVRIFFCSSRQMMTIPVFFFVVALNDYFFVFTNIHKSSNGRDRERER